jgi:V/A-type H+-transporting ATPase subunit D
VPDRPTPVTVSRSAFLGLRDEEQLVQAGYRFLDEKRVQLAAEILQQREAYHAARDVFVARCEQAAESLLEAAATLGVDALQVLPPARFDARLSVDSRPFVGMSLMSAELGFGDLADTDPEQAGAVGDCIDALRAVLVAGVPLAAIVANLERLMHEYQRTERRVRALENVILPEIRSDLAMMEEHLDLNDQEEVIRVHTLRGRRYP